MEISNLLHGNAGKPKPKPTVTVSRNPELNQDSDCEFQVESVPQLTVRCHDKEVCRILNKHVKDLQKMTLLRLSLS